MNYSRASRESGLRNYNNYVVLNTNVLMEIPVTKVSSVTVVFLKFLQIISKLLFPGRPSENCLSLWIIRTTNTRTS